MLDIDYFYSNPEESWKAIREIFYDFFGKAKPNAAHLVLAKLEQIGVVKTVVTQNIDNLHFEAGSKNVYEFHGNSNKLICIKCSGKHNVDSFDLEIIPPKCPDCGGILKPDFIFFGEGIPTKAYNGSFNAALMADVVLVIGSTGEVMPACHVPIQAKQNGAIIIEINPGKSAFTDMITDIYIPMKASKAMEEIWDIFLNDSSEKLN